MVEIKHGVRYQGRPSSDEMKRRWDLASEAMKAQGIDCLIMQANEGLLCQYVRWFAERRTSRYCVIMFDQQQNLSIIGHGPQGNKMATYGMEFANSICVPQVENAWYGNNAISDQAIGIIQKNGYKKIGLVAQNIISAAFYQNLVKCLPTHEIVDATEMVDLLVSVKSQEELTCLREAVRVHEAAGAAIPSLVYAGRLEREFGADLYRLAILAGADEYLSNINVCAQPVPGPMHQLHYQNKIMEAGDTLNVLFEVPTLTGYYADLHHYWSLGEANPDVVKAMELGIEAHAFMAKICKPGVRACDVFVQVNEWNASHGLEPERRMAGHGQGYGLVERPYFDAWDPMVLQENMFVAFHPTIGVNGAQVSPSSNYIITPDGAQRVSTFSQEIIQI
jgi:Xaa-Pro aminopeptidase